MYLTIYGNKTMTDNPLAQYFRTASIHLDLPSGGKYYPAEALNMPATGELPVFPMTALDEITYKTPDALFNGSAIVEVIKSCIPAITDPWQMPITDITAVLAAIRIASFGHDMEIETTCPKCEEKAEYAIDLRNIIESCVAPDYTTPLQIGDLSIFFKPMLYHDLNENSKLQFEEERMSNIVANVEMDTDEQVRLISEAYKKVSKYTVITLAKNIKTIVTPDATVDEEEYILEYLENCENEIYKKIKKEVIAQKNTEALKPLQITCGEEKCGHKYEQPFILDMTSFFAQDS